MNALEPLAKTALLGTERRAPEWPALEGAIGELMRAVEGDSVEQKFLRTAGVIGTCQLAGWMPAPAAGPALEACAAETLSHLIHEPLEQSLAGIFSEGPLRLQAEACACLAKSQTCLPRPLLPKALDAGRRSVPLRALLLPVLGQRGAWLAQLNPDWDYAAGAGADVMDNEVWEHGSLDQRKLFLRTLRPRDPVRARQRLTEAFATEGARERAALLEEMKTGLGLEDEDFLESILRDKSKEVRETAARLLGSLPGSRFMARMAARLEPCVTAEKKFLRGTVVKLEPPAVFDPAWKADLIEESKPQSQKLGERAWWLYQLVRFTPLEWWPQRTGMKVADVLRWAAGSEWKDALLQGWAAAQSLQRRADWAEALLGSGLAQGISPEHFELLEALPPADRESHFLSMVQEAISRKTALSHVLDRFMQVLPLDAHLQSTDMARRLWRAVKDHIHSGSAQHDWQLKGTLVDFACLLPVALLDEAQQSWDLARPEAQPFAEAIARLSTVLDQRKQLSALRS
jgi:hypothetical protein